MTASRHPGLILGIDVGTTSVKVVAVDKETAQVRVSESAQYRSRTAPDGAHEQDAEVWWDLVCACIRRLFDRIAPRDVSAIGMSGHMHTLLLIDDHLRPVAPAMTWADRRASVADLSARDPDFCTIAGNRLGAAFTAVKLGWVARNAPQLLGRARWMISVKDFIRLKLTGTLGTDRTDAIGTLLFDLANREWSRELFAACGADARLGPPVSASTDIVGCVTPEAARLSGIPEAVPVVAGAGDVVSATIGVGLIDGADVALSAGTAAQACRLLATPNPGNTFLFGSALTESYLAMMSVYSAGACLRWFETAFLGGEPIEPLAAQAPAGASGLSYLPFMFGRAHPYRDDAATAAFIGQRDDHRKADFARAVVEGVAFACAESVDAVSSDKPVSGQVLVSGGVARSAIWRDTLAGVVRREVVHVPHGGSALGAAILAGVGIGTWRPHEISQRLAAGETVIAPTSNDAIPNAFMRYEMRVREAAGARTDTSRDIGRRRGV